MRITAIIPTIILSPRSTTIWQSSGCCTQEALLNLAPCPSPVLSVPFTGSASVQQRSDQQDCHGDERYACRWPFAQAGIRVIQPQCHTRRTTVSPATQRNGDKHADQDWPKHRPKRFKAKRIRCADGSWHSQPHVPGDQAE